MSEQQRLVEEYLLRKRQAAANKARAAGIDGSDAQSWDIPSSANAAAPPAVAAPAAVPANVIDVSALL